MLSLASLPASLKFRHPAVLVATFFGAGLIRPAPGTLTSLLALPVAWAIAGAGGPAALLLAAVGVFALGTWAASIYDRADDEHDSNSIVIDEVAGQWIALLLAPQSLLVYAIAFLAFRVFDVFKPWPICVADRHVGGGFGVMLDDVLAGLYALAVVAAATALGVV